MANRLKFRETITKAKNYIRKHYVHQRVYIETYEKRKHNENIIMNSTHNTHTKMYDMCYLIMPFFRFANQKIFFFHSGRRNPEAIRRWYLEISRQEFQECHDWAKLQE